MKQYVIDQLRESDYERIRDYLDANTDGTAMEGVYRVEIPEELYSERQREHAGCRPFYFAVNLNRRQVGFEWLIRSAQTLRCQCIGYATQAQRDYIINYADDLLDVLQIKL